MPVHWRLLSESPEYRAARATIEDATWERSSQERRFPGVARIPVVVHVVFNTTAQNISDGQITSQIDVLNETSVPPTRTSPQCPRCSPASSPTQVLSSS